MVRCMRCEFRLGRRPNICGPRTRVRSGELVGHVIWTQSQERQAFVYVQLAQQQPSAAAHGARG